MAKFVKLESGEIINVDQIVAVEYNHANEAQTIYTTALERGFGDISISLRFAATRTDVDNILKASEK